MGLKLPLATPSELRALERLASDARHQPAVAKVVVFGSRVRGDFRGDSDLDVLLIIENIESRSAAASMIGRIESEMDVSLSPVIYTVSEIEGNRRLGSAFVENVEKEGITLYDAQRPGKS